MQNKIGIIIQREFNERIRKKSFIVITILMPLLMVGLMIAPALIMMYAKSDIRTIAVIDQSGIVAPLLENDDEVVYEVCDLDVEAARQELTSKYAVLYIGKDIVENSSNVSLYLNESSALVVEHNITSQLEEIIKNERLKKYEIENFDQIMKDVNATVNLSKFRNDKSSETDERAGSSELASGLGYILGMMLYMFILIYGMMVLQSVIDEKSNRVSEIIISSISPFQLMMGKILGIASVAVTQILIWIVMICGTATIALPLLLPQDITESISVIQQGGEAMATADLDASTLSMLAMATDFSYIGMIFIYMLLFMVGGYLLYSAMFAAVGSAVDNIQDVQQLQTPIMIPIFIGIMLSMAAIKDPNSALAFWGSMIPLTSPIVMMARIPYEIDIWQIVLSLVILYTSFVAMVWVSAKIYRIGILLHGKKPSFKDLYKWLRY